MISIRLATLIAILGMPVSAQDAESGRETYERYCAVCHGIEATGNGPMQPVLTISPVDLTRLTVENDGTFPMARVIKRIDGRDPLVSHGSPMPIYGDFFEGDDMTIKTPAGQPVMTSRPVVELVKFLQLLQVETD